MKNLNQKTLAVTTAAVLGLGISGTASAGGIAFSNLLISGFQWNHGTFNDLNNNGVFDPGETTTGTQVALSDFSSISISDVARHSAHLGAASAGPLTATREAGTGDPTLGTADPAEACVGPDCVAQSNVFGPTGGQNTVSPDTFSRADTLLTGAIIAGTDQPSQAQASLVTETQIDGLAGNGGASSTVTDGTELTFEVNTATNTVFSFNGQAFARAFMNQEDLSAAASRSFVITLTSGNSQIFSWAPDGNLGSGFSSTLLDAVEEQDNFALTTTISQLDSGDQTSSGNGPFKAFTGVFQPGVEYTLSIRGNTDSDLTLRRSVPEPATLALLSVGLLGMGAASSRRRRKV